MIDRLATDLLGRHVAYGAHHCARISVDLPRRHVGLCFVPINRLDQFSQPEVENFDAVVSGDE